MQGRLQPRVLISLVVLLGLSSIIIYTADQDGVLVDVIRTKYNSVTGPNIHGQVVENVPTDYTISETNSRNKTSSSTKPRPKIDKLSNYNHPDTTADTKPDRLVVFPKSFPMPKTSLDEFYNHYDPEPKTIVKYNDGTSGFSDPLAFVNTYPESLHQHSFTTFMGDKLQDTCDNILQPFDVEVSQSISFDQDLLDIVKTFINSDTHFAREIQQFLHGDMDQQIEEGTFETHWFRIAGTSVWLEQYGVHFMISRLLYTPSGWKDKPMFSLTYAQIFDENWKELKNIDLIVPTNSPGGINNQFSVEGTLFTRISYPQILPIPAYYDAGHGKFFGPEDPRLLLIKNSYGYQEPLVVFNALHRKIVDKDHDSDTFHYRNYRSMFISWPWKFQRGKRNIEEVPHTFPDCESDATVYNKVTELRRFGLERENTQKNWTPFVDFEERHRFHYDKYVYFIYRWRDLEVLKCELTDNFVSISTCEFVYRMNEDSGNSPVGPLRGGTELVNINSLVNDYNLKEDLPLMKDKQVWVGFARAHLSDCGCGLAMYRPNLVVIVKDSVTGKYKIDMVSSFVSLDVKVMGWEPDRREEYCDVFSVFIPNGISYWSITQDPLTSELVDYMSLTYSIADETIESIQIKGLLKAVTDVLEPSDKGFNNDNVECALDSSVDFCRAYGDSFKDNAPVPRNLFI